MERKPDPVEDLESQNSASNTALNTTNSPFKCKIFGRELASYYSEEDNSPGGVSTPPGGVSTSPGSKSKVHQCTKCHRRFLTKQGLGGHMRTHNVLTAKRRRVDSSDAGERILRDEETKKIEGGSLKEEEEVTTASSSDINDKKESVSVVDLTLRL